MPHDLRPEPDIFLLGYSDDVRALVDHLRAEAPSLLDRVAVVDPDSTVVDRLKSTGLRSVCSDLTDPSMLREAGIPRARIIALFPDARTRRTTDAGELVRISRLLSPAAQVFVAADDGEAAARLQAAGAFKVLLTAPQTDAAPSSPPERPARVDRTVERQVKAGRPKQDSMCFRGGEPLPLPRGGTGSPIMRARVLSWRFWALVGITLLDGLIFVMPVVLTAKDESGFVTPASITRCNSSRRPCASCGPGAGAAPSWRARTSKR